MAKVYISCHDSDPANSLAMTLRTAGHEVVSTWHGGNRTRPAANDAAEWSDRAAANFYRIREADWLVIIASPQHMSGERCVTGGKFVEAGYAIGERVQVATLGGVENGMLYHPAIKHANNTRELLAVIERN